LSSAKTQGTLKKVVLTLAPWVKNQVHLLCCSITQGAKAEGSQGRPYIG